MKNRITKMKYRITNQKQLRKEFKEYAVTAGLSLKRIDGGSFVCDTRCAFVYYVDSLARNGDISNDLAQRAYLD